MGKHVHPTRKTLVAIAESASRLADSLRQHWYIFDCTVKENPARAIKTEALGMDQMIRRLVEVNEALKALETLLEGISPGSALDGLGWSNVEAYRPTVPPGCTAVMGWPFTVSEGILTLQQCCGSVRHAMNLTPEATKMQPLERGVAESIEVAAARLASEARTGGKPRVLSEEANIRAREVLKGRLPKGRKRWTERTLAKAIGCSATLAHELPAWQAYAEEHGLKRDDNTRAQKAVGLSKSLLEVKGQEDAQLERLIAEHVANYEESPLVSSARKHRRRPKV